MKLTRQLALVSLAALILPWAALQSLHIFDNLLREGQTAALQATANAIAARLGGDSQLLTRAGLGTNPATDRSRELYVHSLPSPPQLDGRAADWSTYPLAPLALTSSDGPQVQLRAGLYRNKLYLLLQVADPKRQFHRQGSDQLASGDHLALFAGEATNERYYAIRAPLPGEVQALYRDSAGLAQTDYRIRGFWHETDGGYAVELSMPAGWAQNRLAVSAVDKSPAGVSHTGTLGELAPLVGGTDPGVLPDTYGRLVSDSASLNQALKAFSDANLRISVLDKHQWLRGQSGALRQSPGSPATPWYLRLLKPRRTLPEWQDFASGQWPNMDEGQTQAHWYRHGNADIAQVSAPVYRNWPESGAVESQRAGLVVVEQRINPWRIIDNRAARNLLGLTLGAGLVLLALLVGYALWLSLRIRRLSRAAQLAEDNREALNQTLTQWPSYRVNDELAELSDQYRQLLEQVRAHTDYLKTLTSKLAHELRTPLAVVNSSLDNLHHSHDPAPYIQRARQGTQRLSSLVNAMTEASRMEASIASAEREEIDLAQLLSDMSAAYQDAYPNQRFTCEIEPHSAGAYHCAVAPELLVQLLDKLVDNATSFSADNTTITLRLGRADNPEPQLLLSVHNQGPPLPAELEGQLFNSLTSSRPQSGDKQLHLGLGLYIVDLIARYHEAKIWGENIDGGVTFYLLLPIKAPKLVPKRTEDS
ncbi:ATP-binding protein [Gilvimarinus sp. DA14]|uniref:ATP-binding protein n=1 Tax=Gilvimarinus sp. DA14 TaxID=2956798 RepID=UPI0020B6894B|nr:ATP-binding protein [Gilvimarinus sp. DA14]UTF60000.1 ATP-binding protein [Gilvimarinus sp. DA14]